MALTFESPGHGHWALDRSHYPTGVTPISQWLLSEGFANGFSRVFAELGLPAAGMDTRFVHGYMYTRLQPLIGPDSKPRKPPPAAVLKIAARLHPAFRARNKTAMATLRDRPSNAVVQRWETELRPRLHATNRAFQAFDAAAANDVELQNHITTLLDQLRQNFVLHFWLHGHDLGPIARYLHQCLQWGLDPNRAISALAGASPTTALPMQTLLQLRALLEAAPDPITSLEDLRASSDEARDLLDAYLDERGHVLAGGYYLDIRALGEMPDVILSSIRTAARIPIHNPEGIAGDLRNAVAASNRAAFDQLLADARNVMDMRDDNGPLTLEWPLGLMRRALLAAGQRLVDRGALTLPEHLFEITPAEARALFGGELPAADELAERADKRRAQGLLDPPISLGKIEPEPPLTVLPDALAQLTAMVQVARKYVGLDGTLVSANPLAGVGVGTQAYVGTARVAQSADEAFDQLEPGDVLVVRATSPAFNAVLAIAGAVVTSEGGVLSHAAVLARELGIPAIIGVSGALDLADGATIEVDPGAGLVKLID